MFTFGFHNSIHVMTVFFRVWFVNVCHVFEGMPMYFICVYLFSELLLWVGILEVESSPFRHFLSAHCEIPNQHSTLSESLNMLFAYAIYPGCVG